MDDAEFVQLSPEWFHDRLRQDGNPVFGTFAVAHRDRLHAGIHLLEAQAPAFGQSQSRAVEQSGGQPRRAFQSGQHRPRFAMRQHCRQRLRLLRPVNGCTPGQINPEGLAGAEQDGVQHLVLRGGGHVSIHHREMREERVDLGSTHFTRVALAGKQDEPLDPADLRPISPDTVAASAPLPAHLVTQARPARRVLVSESSETKVKRSQRTVGDGKCLVEKLGCNDPCPCGSGRRFQEVLPPPRTV